MKEVARRSLKLKSLKPPSLRLKSHRPKSPRPEAPARRAAKEGPEPTGALSPLVRKMARENSIDISKVKGTGAGGRITKQDLEGFMVEKEAPAPAPPATPAAQPPAGGQ